MKTKEFEVKAKSKVVATVDVPVYDTLQEAVEAEGEARVLDYFNAQNKTNIMNAARTAKTQKLSKKVLREKALAEITPEEFTSCAGDMQKITQLIESKMAAIEARVKAEMEAAGENPDAEDEEEEDDDS